MDQLESLGTYQSPDLALPLPQARTGTRQSVQDIVQTILLALLLFAALQFVVQNFRIEGRSMEPNLHDGDFVLVDRISYRLRLPQRGDVIVFHAPSAPGRDFIKRVIGLPGDTIEIHQGQVFVNSALYQEPYIPDLGTRSWGPQTVGPEEFFVLGDNRPCSNDSRQWGMLPQDDLIGKALFAYWPMRDRGPLHPLEARVTP